MIFLYVSQLFSTADQETWGHFTLQKLFQGLSSLKF